MFSVNEENLPHLCSKLAEKDSSLALIFKTYGTPPLWRRDPGFATLIHIILEQQVSLASALSAFNKLKAMIGDITPENVLALSDSELKTAYFSRQKTLYARCLAEAILSGKLNIQSLGKLPDEEVKRELKNVKGIGDWTADIYLLMALLRADVMPKGDLALHAAWQRIEKSDKRPASEQFLQTAEKWKPFRSVAARLLWHFYLSAKKSDIQV